MLLALCSTFATAANLPTLKLLPRLSALTTEGAPDPAEPMPYTAVSLLTTHGAGHTVTEKDRKLAKAISALESYNRSIGDDR